MQFVEARSAGEQYVLGGLLLATVAAIDAWTGPEIAFSIFYLLPIAMLAWHTSWTAARTAVLASGLAWLLADVVAGASYTVPIVQYWNALVRTGVFYIVGLSLSELRYSLREEHRLARTDALTGVSNSRSFLEYATQEFARQRRYNHPVSVGFLDCDNFKRVNDRHGHAAGDQLLCLIALTISQTIREVDMVARLGGDEFVILLPESDQKAAATVGKKVREALRRAAGDLGVTFSMGMVTYLEPPHTVDEMLNSADQLMYQAKRAGKNTTRHQVFGADEAWENEQGVMPGLG